MVSNPRLFWKNVVTCLVLYYTVIMRVPCLVYKLLHVQEALG